MWTSVANVRYEIKEIGTLQYDTVILQEQNTVHILISSFIYQLLHYCLKVIYLLIYVE